jgi:cysteine-rich repeat protein
VGVVALLGVLSGRAPAASDPIACRSRIARSQLRLIRVGFRQIDACHRRLNRGRDAGTCNVLPVSSNTPYPRTENRMEVLVPVRCPADLATVRDNFPACTGSGCDNILTTVVPDVRARLEENSDALLTPKPLGPPFAACQRAIADGRSAVARAVTKRAFACQRRLDRTRGGFGSLAAECLVDAGHVAAAAARRIRHACRGVDPTPLATCAPLPTCVVEVATALGQDLAKLAYGSADRCGDGVRDPGEGCDDGNHVATDACTDKCVPARCGDGIVWEGVEECDDGNQVANDGCDNSCHLPVCGDGRVAGSEQCDDGNDVPDDGCTDCMIDPVRCGAGGLRAFVDYDDPNNSAAAGGTMRISYPADVSIPGSGPLRGPVVNTSSATNGTFLPRDADTDADGVDDAVEIVFALGSSPWPTGSFASIDFTCSAGTPVLAPDFACRLLSASDLFSNALDPASLRCGVVALERIP